MESTNRLYFKELLHSRDLKATSTRIQLLENLDQHQAAMPYSAIQNTMKKIDRVTLYRTIDSLMSQGIIHQAYKENNETYYALCGKTCDKENHNHEHIHFKCLVCLAVTCQELHAKIEIALPAYDIHQISISVTGVCDKCK